MSVQQTTAEQPLQAFRQAVYQTLGRRKDTLYELLEAAVVAFGPANLAHLSMTEVFRRKWASASDALAAGQVYPARCRALIHTQVDDRPVSGRPVWAGDGTTWPKPAAKISPEGGSGVRPLDVRRRGPRSGTPTEVAVRELRAALARRPDGATRPVGVYDSSYDAVTFVRAGCRSIGGPLRPLHRHHAITTPC